MSRKQEFGSANDLLGFLQNAFTRSAWCDVFGPDIISEKKRGILSRVVSSCANAGGGNYYIGARVKGKNFAGVDAIAEDQTIYLENIIQQSVFPYIEGLSVRYYPLENESGKGIVHLYIPDSPLKPFMASDYRYYLRTGLRENLMEEYQVRTLFRSASEANIELAGIINTNGIPEYSEGILTDIRFYPKFLIRNNGSLPSGIYKFELFIPSDLHDTSFTALQNYFNRLEGIHSVFSFPSRSTVFQGETIAVAEAKIQVSQPNISTFVKKDLRIVLYSDNGVKNYDHRLSELFTIDGKPLSADLFKNVKSLNQKI